MSSTRLHSARLPLNSSTGYSGFNEDSETRHSTTLWQSRITADVWLEVLKFLSVSDVVAFSHVCSWFRAIALDHSQLWRDTAISCRSWKTRDYIVDPCNLKEFFRRSRRQPLSISLVFDDIVDPALAVVLSNEADRVKSLSVIYEHRQVIKQSGLLFGSIMPLLHSLKLHGLLYGRTEDRICITTILPAGTVPSLRTLTTSSHVGWNIAAPRLFPNLVTLDTAIHATEDVIAILDACPSLTSLKLDVFKRLKPVTSFTSSTLIAGRRLQKIHLCGSSEMDIILSDLEPFWCTPIPNTILTLLDLAAPRQSFRIDCCLGLPSGAKLFEQFPGMTEWSKTAAGSHRLIVTAKNNAGDTRELVLPGYNVKDEYLVIYKQFWSRMEAARRLKM